MSGDVQPRKRKDKKRKRDSLDRRSEGEIFTRKLSSQDDEDIKESHYGVHATKMGRDDVHIHVQSEHGTGGHWCAKIFFFSLLTILLGVVGLIILENRGSSDIDTPLSESRFSDYFEGWVDEHRQAHDDHHDTKTGLESHEDGHNPFKEEEDNQSTEVEGDHADDDDNDEEEKSLEDIKDDESNAADEEDDDEHKDDDDEVDESNNEDDLKAEEDEEEEEDDEEQTHKNKRETGENDGDEGLEDDNNDEDENGELDTNDNELDAESPFEEDDDDFDDDDDDNSLEQVVDNDAGEKLHLRRKAEEEELVAKAGESQETDDADSAPQVRGPQSINHDDFNFDDEVYRANDEMLNDNLQSALNIYDSLILRDPDSIPTLYGKAKVLDRLSDKYRNNHMLRDAIDAYRVLLNLGEKLDDETFRYVAERCLDRMRFIGMLAQAVPVHRKLMRRFSDDPEVRNQLAVTYLLQNRYEEAKYILHHTLMRWRDNGFAQVHYGFILKVHDNDLKGSVALLREGIASGANGTKDGRFFFALGDALYRLGKKNEAMDLYREGAELKLFPSLYQRSLYNVNGLKAQPFWTEEDTTYAKEFANMKRNWELIRNEGLSLLNIKDYFVDEAEDLRRAGEWKQLELFARGRRVEKNCLKAPLTCSIIETFLAARFCKRGQVKFSVMHPGTHVWPHCGPTNCRLRAHLGLVVPFGTKLRVATDEKVWKEGEWLIFDDSFEHEVWHNGTSLRLVLIVDIWHPDLTELQRDTLSPM